MSRITCLPDHSVAFALLHHALRELWGCYGLFIRAAKMTMQLPFKGSRNGQQREIFVITIWHCRPGEPFVVKKAVCLHEEDAGLLWKHVEYRNGQNEVRRSRRLVISMVRRPPLLSR